MNMNRKWLVALALIGIVIGNISFWNWYYVNGVQNSYDLGFLDGKQSGYYNGFTDGNKTGHKDGYGLGYSMGNYSGYLLGYERASEIYYDLGFYYGNISGYQKGFTNGNTIGFAIGYIEGVRDGAGTGYNIRNPTYEEMLNFIAIDKTNQNQYSENYTCLHFTADVKSNAFKAGYRCGFVYIEFVDGAHSIVCFNTTNSGLIFIEPQSDEIVRISIGGIYWGSIITMYVIIW